MPDFVFIMSYLPRITDVELARKLEASGAVLIRGPKACGKTESATQQAKSAIHLDQDQQTRLLYNTAPERILSGDTPRLIDEWQTIPDVWNRVRREVNVRKKKGQFILTGSAQPEEDATMHSGAGRFTIVDMRTLSWQEMGLSTGEIKLGDLLIGKPLNALDTPTELEAILHAMAKGGFPSEIESTLDQATEVHIAYLELLAEVDLGRVSKFPRDPQKVRNLLKSLARNSATDVDLSTLGKDIKANETEGLSRPTLYNYLDVLKRMMLVEEQPAWNTHLRSAALLRNKPKLHLADVCLAVAALGADPESLLNNLKFSGFLFESLVTHDLRIYSQALGANVYHYRDSSGLEVDCIVQKRNDDWCAFEIKLGTNELDKAAANLLKLASTLDPGRTTPPKSLNIITGTGVSHTRADGVNVISFGSLGV